jgi:hypothetical protein
MLQRARAPIAAAPRFPHWAMSWRTSRVSGPSIAARIAPRSSSVPLSRCPAPCGVARRSPRETCSLRQRTPCPGIRPAHPLGSCTTTTRAVPRAAPSPCPIDSREMVGGTGVNTVLACAMGVLSVPEGVRGRRSRTAAVCALRAAQARSPEDLVATESTECVGSRRSAAARREAPEWRRSGDAQKPCQGSSPATS